MTRADAMTGAKQAIFEAMNEAEFQDMVIEALGVYGFEVFHDNDSRRNREGFPDIVAVHRTTGVTVFLELKREKKYKITPAQQSWIDMLSLGNFARIVRPSEWDQCEKNILALIRSRHV